MKRASGDRARGRAGRWGLTALAMGAALAAAVALSRGDPAAQETGPPAERPAPEEEWKPPRFEERKGEREIMVTRQLSHPRDGRRPVKDERVLEAMRQVPRHLLAGSTNRDRAYSDSALPIGYGQTISQPYIVALMTEALELKPGSKVLEIGTGSGYQAAVLSELTRRVHSIEIIKGLAHDARETLDTLGYTVIQTRQADGYFGWPEEAPFDAIIVTCAAGHLPPPLWDQLAPGGRICIPIGNPMQTQRLTVITRTEEGTRRSKVITLCTFVPMTGKILRR